MGHLLEKLGVTALVGMVPQSAVRKRQYTMHRRTTHTEVAGYSELLSSSGGNNLITVHTFSGRPF